jgi:hypothetical protein
VFLPIRVAEIPTGTERRIELDDDQAVVELGLHQGILLRIQRELGIEYFEVVGLPNKNSQAELREEVDGGHTYLGLGYAGLLLGREDIRAALQQSNKSTEHSHRHAH